MSSATDHAGVPDDDLLAAEYVLGVLAGQDRAAAERLLQRDIKFAALVAAWEARLTPWAAEAAAIAPPLQLWGRIAAALPAPTPNRASLWQNIAFWRGAAFAGALTAACLVIAVYFGAIGGSQPLIATIEGGGKRSFIATVDIRRGTIAVIPASFTADATRVPELWLIPGDGKPRPIGLLNADRGATLTIPPQYVAQAVSDAVLAVSLEPPGGSPTGQPTGPVIGTGKLTSL